jgi:hypothetical protein
MLCKKFDGNDELCLVGKNFSFEMRFEMFVIMKSIPCERNWTMAELNTCVLWSW